MNEMTAIDCSFGEDLNEGWIELRTGRDEEGLLTGNLSPLTEKTNGPIYTVSTMLFPFFGPSNK